jgi:hypothetical protein
MPVVGAQPRVRFALEISYDLSDVMNFTVSRVSGGLSRVTAYIISKKPPVADATPFGILV